MIALLIGLITVIISIILIVILIRDIKRDHRRKKVVEFRNLLTKLECSYNYRRLAEEKYSEVNKTHEWFTDKWTFNEMLYSSKPLKLLSWYTNEELKRINS